VAELVDALA